MTVIERAVGRLQTGLDHCRREGFIAPRTDEQIRRGLARSAARRRQAKRERREREDTAAWAPFIEHLERTKAKP